MDGWNGLQMAPFSRKKQKTKRGRSHQSTSITAGQPSAFQAGSCFDNTDQDGRGRPRPTTHCPVKSPSCRAASNLGDFCTTPPCPRFCCCHRHGPRHVTCLPRWLCQSSNSKKIAQTSAHPLGRPRPRPRHLHLLRAPPLRRPLPFSQPTPLSPPPGAPAAPKSGPHPCGSGSSRRTTTSFMVATSSASFTSRSHPIHRRPDADRPSLILPPPTSSGSAVPQISGPVRCSSCKSAPALVSGLRNK